MYTQPMGLQGRVRSLVLSKLLYAVCSYLYTLLLLIWINLLNLRIRYYIKINIEKHDNLIDYINYHWYSKNGYYYINLLRQSIKISAELNQVALLPRKAVSVLLLGVYLNCIYVHIENVLYVFSMKWGQQSQ